MARFRSSSKNNSTTNLGFEANLWPSAGSDLSSPPPLLFRLQTFRRLANLALNNFDTAPRGRANRSKTPNPQIVREAQDSFRKDDDVRWQWREATWTTNGRPKGERNQAHQYPSPQRGNANFACVQHFIHHLAPFFFWNRNTDATRRDRREETGAASSAIHEMYSARSA